MLRLRRARLRTTSEDGAAAVEFALVVPLLIALLFGIIEFGAAYNAQIVVTNAAREASRAITVSDSSSTSAQLGERGLAAARAAVQPIGLTVAPGQMTYTLAGSATGSSTRPCPPGQRVTVDVTVTRPMLTGLFGASFDISGTATRLCAG